MTTLQRPLLRVLSALCESADSPRSLGLLLRAKYGCMTGQDGLLSQRTDPSAYQTSYQYLKDNACTEFLRKCRLDGVVSESDRRVATLSGFWIAERDCRQTNARFQRYQENHSLSVLDAKGLDCLDRARSFLRHILGPVPETLNGGFGPGATYGDKGQLTTVPDKITSRIQMTRGASQLSMCIERTAWFRSLVTRQPPGGPFEFVRGNRFTTVPKTALKDRGICIEPSANLFLQKAVGSLLKRKILQKFPVDLLHAQSVHRRMAQEGSRYGSFSTIDLEAASDTVSLEVVRYLLPPDWFDLLSMLRSPETFIEGNWIKLGKFSSMGNGYTFELETLIFASIAYAMGAGIFGLNFWVFGDDIIVPTGVARDVVAMLRFCGFKTNESKTFLDGPFRESCGGDFFRGVPVRAHNVEKEPTTPEDWISLANGLRRLGSLDPGCDFRDSFTHTAWMRCLDAIPSDIRRLRGPATLGDIVINDDTGFNLRVRNGVRYIRVYRPIGRTLFQHHWKGSVLYAAALYGSLRSRKSGLAIVQTRGVSGHKVGWVSIL